MRTLTRDEARTRAALLEVASYDVHLELGPDPHFTSVCEVRFVCREPGASTFLELDGELVALERGGTPVAAVVQGNRIVLDDLAAQEVVRVTARCAKTRTGEGLHRAVDPEDGEVYLYAMTFLDDAQRLFACFDQPDLKASYALTVDAPQGWRVLSNTRAELTGARHAFAPSERIATYLMTLAAGPYEGVQAWHDGVELGVWCRRSQLPHLEADELLGITRACLDLQQELFGRRYPFGDSYDQLFAPEFNAGAMENPGLVVLSDEAYVFRSRTTQGRRRARAQVVAHEMAHMWFGDLVTMRWWDDLWLNESFAEMLGVLTVDEATAYEGAWSDFCLSRKAWGYRADALPTTHPVAGDVSDTRTALLNFDGISYAKGASVLRQLQAALGRDVFFAGVRAYLAEHAWGSTSLADLLAALERASGRDLQEWARVWLRTSGTSTLRVRDGVLHQEGAVLRPHRVAVGAYVDDGTALHLADRVELDVAGERTPLPGGLAGDLVLPNDGDLTFATLRLDDASLATALTSTGRLADPLARALVHGALWDTVRGGELAAGPYVAAVLASVGAEGDPETVTTLLGQARTAAARYTADGAALLAALHEHSARAARSLPPGDDLQLVHVRAAVSAADDGAALLAWLDGDALPEGVVLDADLRWHLLVRLAAFGVVDVDRVERERARDRTAAGEQSAATAHAALPDPGGKQAVWQELLGGGELSNARARSSAAGFWQRGQEDLLRPYVARYADEVAGLWQRRSEQLATTLADRLFPHVLVEHEVLERTAPLVDEARPAALRRTVLEQRDELARALRARSSQVRG